MPYQVLVACCLESTVLFCLLVFFVFLLFFFETNYVDQAGLVIN